MTGPFKVLILACRLPSLSVRIHTHYTRRLGLFTRSSELRLSPVSSRTNRGGCLLGTHAESSRASRAAGKLGRQLGVLLGDLHLCSCRLGIGEGVDDLTLGSGELGRTLEVLEGSGHVVLLEKKLGHGGNGNIALGINYKGLELVFGQLILGLTH